MLHVKFSLNIFFSKTAHYNILITQLHKEIGSDLKLIKHVKFENCRSSSFIGEDV